MTESEATVHPLETAIALQKNGTGRFVGHTTVEFANMVGPFGGVTAAAIIRAIEEHPDRLGEPLALTVNYAAAIGDGPFDVAVRPVRTNRTNQHWTAELTQNGDITTTATAITGTRRQAWSETEATMPAVPKPEISSPATFPVSIAWMDNYDIRYVEGGPPDADGGESPSSTSVLWVRHRPARGLDFPSLAAISDVFFPRVFLRRGQMSPAGTISMTTYFHADSDELTRQGSDFVLATAHGQRFNSGYFDQTGQVWGRDGTLLVTTHQIAYYKD